MVATGGKQAITGGAGRSRLSSLSDAARRLAAIASQRMASPGFDEPSKPDDLSFVAYRRNSG